MEENNKNTDLLNSVILEWRGFNDSKEVSEERLARYYKLTIHEKILLESQEQTRKINKIYDNIRFFFWLAILSMAAYAYLLLTL